MNQPRTVQCIKLGEQLPAMPFKPFPTEFGQLIYDRVSMQAWRMWLQESPRYINTYRIDLQSAEGRDFLEKQMRVFFGFESGELAETAWTSPSGPGEAGATDPAGGGETGPEETGSDDSSSS